MRTQLRGLKRALLASKLLSLSFFSSETIGTARLPLGHGGPNNNYHSSNTSGRNSTSAATATGSVDMATSHNGTGQQVLRYVKTSYTIRKLRHRELKVSGHIRLPEKTRDCPPGSLSVIPPDTSTTDLLSVKDRICGRKILCFCNQHGPGFILQRQNLRIRDRSAGTHELERWPDLLVDEKKKLRYRKQRGLAQGHPANE